MKADDYLAQAERAKRLADATTSEKDRRSLLNYAARLRALADAAAEKTPNAQERDPRATPP